MKLISTHQIDTLCQQAATSPRGRAHRVLHAGNDDPVQRFFVAADLRTYVRPHRHCANSELTVVLRGCFDLLVFDAAGVLLDRHTLGADSPDFAYEAPINTWHTLLAGADSSVFLEVKEGPYNPATAAEFAPWAPAEGDASVPAFQKWLRHAQPGERAPELTA